MSKKYPVQYSILRYTHDLATGEFLNVGFVVYSKEEKFFKIKLLKRYSRITAAFPGAEGKFLTKYIGFLQSRLEKTVAQMEKDPLGLLQYNKLEDIIYKILPIGDTSLNFTPPQGGLCSDLEDFFENRYFRLVEYYLDDKTTNRIDEKAIWQNYYRKPFQEANVLRYIEKRKIKTNFDTLEFEHTWKNSKISVLEPLSFDLTDETYMKNKAYKFLGMNVQLQESLELKDFYYLVVPPKDANKAMKKAFGDSIDILNRQHENYKTHIIHENEFSDFSKDVIPKIKAAVEHEG